MDWIEIMSVVVNAVLLPILAWAVAEFTGYVKSKANKDALDKYFDLANDAVVTAVEEVMQTFVSTMKKAGTWSDEIAAEALQMAKMRAQEVMGAAAYKALTEIVADVDAWLTSKVEAATLQVKHTVEADSFNGLEYLVECVGDPLEVANETSDTVGGATDVD